MAKLKDLSVSFLSLVRTPATGKGLTLKSKRPGDRVATFDIAKTDDDRMIAFGIVYAPDEVDAHGDSADAQTIRRAAYEFMREARLKNIDTEHSFSSQMAFVAESWLVRKGDPLFADEPEGAWAVGIQIGDPDLWAQLKAGELTGILLAGIARMEPNPSDPADHRYTEKDAVPGWFQRLFPKLATKNPEETDMDKNEVQGIVRDTLKAELGPALADALKSAGIAAAAPVKTEASEVEKAVAAALKAAGIEPKADDPVQADTDLEKAIAKAWAAYEAKLDDKIALSLAKGVTETGAATGAVQVEGYA